MFRLLSGGELEGLASSATLVDAIEDALTALVRADVQVPPRVHADWQDGTLLLMPAMDSAAIGVKLVSVIPANAAAQIPVTSGAMLVFEKKSGALRALVDASMLTARRTGAIGATALKWLTAPTLTSVGIVGTGVQGAWLAISACAVRPIAQIFYVRRSIASEKRFRETVSRHIPGVELIACADGADLLSATSAIFTATTSERPVFTEDCTQLEGKQFFAFGSFKPAMQEIPSRVSQIAGKIVVDSEAARHESGDVINPLREGSVGSSDILLLSEILTNQRAPKQAGTTCLFKSVGMAAYDLFVAQTLLREAEVRGVGRSCVL